MIIAKYAIFRHKPAATARLRQLKAAVANSNDIGSLIIQVGECVQIRNPAGPQNGNAQFVHNQRLTMVEYGGNNTGFAAPC